MAAWKLRCVGPAVALLFVLACAVRADDPPAKKVAPKAKPAASEGEKKAEKAEKVDPFLVPKGSPKELLEYIAGLQKQRPAGRDFQAFMEFEKKRSGAVAEAVSRILSADPSDQQAAEAVQHATRAFGMLGQLGDSSAGKRLTELIATLEKKGKKDLVGSLRAMQFSMRLQAAVKDKEQLPKVVDETLAFLSKGPLTAADVNLAMSVSRAAEHGGSSEFAVDACRKVAKLLSSSDNELAGKAAKRIEGTIRRLELPGHPIKIQGAYLDGKPFEPSRFEGKVVLVQFWATWCGPCRAELPNIKENYKKYHDKGFEVIGISLDHSREALDKFLAKDELPWPMLYQEPEPNPTIAYYGVYSIPRLILVGRDGNVISLNARGQELTSQLEKLFGSKS